METVFGGLFNAFAFAGAGFLFSKLNHTGYEKEIKRHNLAMEKLARSKEKWFEKQEERKQEIQKLKQQAVEANEDINQTNKSLENLAKVLNRVKYLENEYVASNEAEPKLEDYYKPSQEMKEYQNILFLIVGLFGGYIIHKFV